VNAIFFKSGRLYENVGAYVSFTGFCILLSMKMMVYMLALLVFFFLEVSSQACKPNLF
jgi:hypothetical protein